MRLRIEEKPHLPGTAQRVAFAQMVLDVPDPFLIAGANTVTLSPWRLALQRHGEPDLCMGFSLQGGYS
jgi:hypothetical protein